MDASLQDHGPAIVRLTPAPGGTPRLQANGKAEGKADRKAADPTHVPRPLPPSGDERGVTPSFLRSLLSSASGPPSSAVRPLASRQAQALPPAPPAVGTIASHEVKSDTHWSVRAAGHAAALGAGALTWSAVGLSDPDADIGDPLPAVAGVLTSALLYAAHYGSRKVTDLWAGYKERRHIESARLGPARQLDRVVALANAQPLTTEGLRHAVSRIRDLKALHPGAISGEAAATAIARLASRALDLPRGPEAPAPGYRERLNLLCHAIVDLHALDGVGAATCGRALVALARHLSPQPVPLPPGVRQRVFEGLVDALAQLRTEADGLPDADHASQLAALTQAPYLGDRSTERATWQALMRGLPGRPHPTADAVIARVAQVRPFPSWMLAHAAAAIGRPHAERLARDLGAYRTYTADIVRLAGALGDALSAQDLRSLVDTHLWPTPVQGLEGVAGVLLGRVPELAGALRWHLDEARGTALVGSLVDSQFFGTRPEPQAAAQHLVALIGPRTPVSTRAVVDGAVMQRLRPLGLPRPERLRDLLAPVTLEAVLRAVPAHLLATEVRAALRLARDGLEPAAIEQVARDSLRIMDVLSQRADAPAGVFLSGLAHPAEVAAMITDLAAQPAGDDNRDRARLIARLPQLCQSSATEALVRQAVEALRGLPELAPQGGNAAQSAQRRQQAGAWAKAACLSAATFICAEDERQARAGDAVTLEEQDFENGAVRPAVPARATLDHAWLTPAFIERMSAPGRDGKHG